MIDEQDFLPDCDPFRDYDFFIEDARQFEEDVHVLVLGTFFAAKEHWSRRLSEELPKIEAAINKASGDYANHLVEEHTHELARNSEQLTF